MADFDTVVRSVLPPPDRGTVIGRLQRQAMLRRLLPALEGAGVPVVVLKGAALAYLSYPDPSLRPMHDVDLWTRPEYIERAAGAALQIGLQYSARLRLRTPSALELRAATTRIFEAPGLPGILEVHSELKSLEGLSQEWMQRAWDRRERRTLGDLTACVLHPEDMLTHLSIHCSRFHGFESGLRPLVDIGFWLRAESSRISWTDLLSSWQREHIDGWALLTLSLAHELAGAPVPADVLEAARGLPHFTETHAIARRLILATGATLPPGLAFLVTSTTRRRAAWLSRRLTAHYWQGPPGTRRTMAAVLRDGTQRIAADVRDKLPEYFRGLVTGTLRGAELRRRTELALDRQRLERLVAAVETTQGGGAQR